MKLKTTHVRYVADKIARDLVNASFVEVLTNEKDIVRVAAKHLEENVKKEQGIEEKVRDFINENIDEIESSGADEKRMFFLMKKKIASENGFILSWDDRYSNLSHKIMDELIDSSVIDFGVSEMMVKNLIFKSINSYVEAYERLEEGVLERMKNYKKKLVAGTEEYELVFEKMYEEELRKQGFL